MFDVVTYALVKKLVGQAATGIAGIEYKDGSLIFTLADGSTISTPLDISSGVVGASLNEEGALVIEFSDGTFLTYAAATKEDLQKVEEKVSAIGKDLETLAASHNNLIDDNSTASNRVWSSNKIVKALTIEEIAKGTNTVTFKAIAATPLDIETTILDAPNTILLEVSSTTGKESSWSCSIPTTGTYNWSTGVLTMFDGTEIQLTSHFITAFDGTSTIRASGVDAIKVKYKTISKQSGPAIDYEIINGGSAKEEA